MDADEKTQSEEIQRVVAYVQEVATHVKTEHDKAFLALVSSVALLADSVNSLASLQPTQEAPDDQITLNSVKDITSQVTEALRQMATMYSEKENPLP